MRRSRRADGEPGIANGRIPLISLIQLLSVAEHLNFHHAARALGVSQSGVSMRIKALEAELGLELFERRHRGVRLTEAGRRFVADISAGITHLDHAVRNAGALSGGAEGTLAIGLAIPLAPGFLSDLRSRCHAIWPGIAQPLTEGRAQDIIALIREGRLDVAFMAGPVETPDCHARALWTEALCVALPEHHRLARAADILWSSLAPETFLVRNGGDGPQALQHLMRRLGERGRPPRIRHCDVGRETGLHMVAAGEGVMLAGEAAARPPFAGIVFRPIADELDQLRYGAVWSPQNRSPALRHLLGLAAEMIRERLLATSATRH